MFYLTTHSTHFIYGYMASDHMVKDQSDSERGNPLPPLNVLLFPISNKGSFYAPSQRQDSTYNGLCYTSHGALAVTRKCLKYTDNCYFHCCAKRVCILDYMHLFIFNFRSFFTYVVVVVVVVVVV